MSLFAGYVIAVAGALLGLLLIVTARVDPKGNAAIQTLLTDLFAPVSEVGRSAVDGMRGVGSSISAYVDAGSKNKAMEAELKAARRKVMQSQADALELTRLRKLMRIVATTQKPVAVSQLVSSTGSSSRRYAILAAGSRDGVANGQSVVSPDGLVGQVVATGVRSARVQLIIDSDVLVPVKRVSDGLAASVTGTGDGRLLLRAVFGSSNPFRKGDLFITSGSGGVYRPGIPVAVAIAGGRDGAFAAPLARASRLDYAVVEREFVEPPPTIELPRAEE